VLDVRLGSQQSERDSRSSDLAREAEQALVNDAIPIHQQYVDGERRFIYYGETDTRRLLALIVTERRDKIRVVTAYDLDAGQKRDSFARRVSGE